MNCGVFSLSSFWVLHTASSSAGSSWCAPCPGILPGICYLTSHLLRGVCCNTTCHLVYCYLLETWQMCSYIHFTCEYNICFLFLLRFKKILSCPLSFLFGHIQLCYYYNVVSTEVPSWTGHILIYVWSTLGMPKVSLGETPATSAVISAASTISSS